MPLIQGWVAQGVFTRVGVYVCFAQSPDALIHTVWVDKRAGECEMYEN